MSDSPEAAGSSPGGGTWLRALLGIAMITLGAGAFLIGSSLQQGGARAVGGNLPINEGAGDKTDINAHNSPTVARNPAMPSNIVVVNRIDTPRFSCGMHVSQDGGAAWKDVEIPFPAGEELPERCFAPDAAFDGSGTLYVSFVTLYGQGNRPNAFWLSTSTDQGKTLSTPAKIIGPAPPHTFQTRLIADPNRSGRIFVTWLQAQDTANLAFPGPGNPIMFLRSEDGGASWIGPATVSAKSRARAVGPSPALGPDGDLYVSYLDLGEDKLDYEGGHEGKGGEPYEG
ncbi:MAG: sialidase family protein, partial [Actinomycetota bacterium]